VGFFLGVGVVCLATVFLYFFQTRSDFIGK